MLLREQLSAFLNKFSNNGIPWNSIKFQKIPWNFFLPVRQVKFLFFFFIFYLMDPKSRNSMSKNFFYKIEDHKINFENIDLKKIFKKKINFTKKSFQMELWGEIFILVKFIK